MPAQLVISCRRRPVAKRGPTDHGPKKLTPPPTTRRTKSRTASGAVSTVGRKAAARSACVASSGKRSESHTYTQTHMRRSHAWGGRRDDKPNWSTTCCLHIRRSGHAAGGKPRGTKRRHSKGLWRTHLEAASIPRSTRGNPAPDGATKQRPRRPRRHNGDGPDGPIAIAAACGPGVRAPAQPRVSLLRCLPQVWGQAPSWRVRLRHAARWFGPHRGMILHFAKRCRSAGGSVGGAQRRARSASLRV